MNVDIGTVAAQFLPNYSENSGLRNLAKLSERSLSNFFNWWTVERESVGRSRSVYMCERLRDRIYGYSVQIILFCSDKNMQPPAPKTYH